MDGCNGHASVYGADSGGCASACSVARPATPSTGSPAHFWKRRIAGDPNATRVRFMHSTLGVITALTACLLLLMTAGSALSALKPATTLLGVLGAG